MSAKKRKSIGQLYICDKCKVILHVKDTSLHLEKSCYVTKNFIHSYIKDSTLHTTARILSDEGTSSIKSIPVEKQSDFVYLSIDVLQLMNIPIGDPVVISVTNSIDNNVISFVKYTWPTIEKNHLLAFLTEEAHEIQGLESMGTLHIYHLKSNLNIAKLITLKCNLPYVGNVLERIKNQNMKNIYCTGNKITHNFYGKLLNFEITGITPFGLGEEGVKRHSGQENTTAYHLITQETDFECPESENLVSNESLETSSLQGVGGMHESVKELEEIVSLLLSNHESILPGLYLTKGVIIFGPSGTGKTSLIEVTAKKFNLEIIKIEGSQIFSKFLGEAEKQLSQYFEKAQKVSPSVVLIDELDVMCPKTNMKNDQERRIISTLSMLLDRIHSSENNLVLVLATTSRINEVNNSLRRPGRFGKEIEIHVPNGNQRKEILKVHLTGVAHELKESDFQEISNTTHGFVGADLVSLISKATLRRYKIRKDGKLSRSDFSWALSKVKPSALREVLIEVPNVKWSDIGGQEELKLKLRQAIEWPLKYENSFKRLGIVPPRGLLMFGPPGCSKTMIAKALATESKLNFLSVKGPELFSKWVGESEKAVREVFRRARQVAPSIVFFDELDAVGGQRSSTLQGTNVEERVLAQLLTELDGVEPLGNVTIVGATNRLDRIDPALLRPGRFDRIVHVPLPDAETRWQIFNIQFERTSIDPSVNLSELVEKTEGYSGAEIVAVCQEAALKALEENFASSSISREHFLSALNIIHPRTPKTLIDMYEKHISVKSAVSCN